MPRWWPSRCGSPGKGRGPAKRRASTRPRNASIDRTRHRHSPRRERQGRRPRPARQEEEKEEGRSRVYHQGLVHGHGGRPRARSGLGTLLYFAFFKAASPDSLYADADAGDEVGDAEEHRTPAHAQGAVAAVPDAITPTTRKSTAVQRMGGPDRSRAMPRAALHYRRDKRTARPRARPRRRSREALDHEDAGRLSAAGKRWAELQPSKDGKASPTCSGWGLLAETMPARRCGRSKRSTRQLDAASAAGAGRRSRTSSRPRTTSREDLALQGGTQRGGQISPPPPAPTGTN